MSARLSKRMSVTVWHAAHITRIAQRRAARSLRHHVARTRALTARLSRDIAQRWSGSVRAWVHSLVHLRLYSIWRASLGRSVRVTPARALRHPRQTPHLRLVRTPRRHAPPSGPWSPYFGGR
ncbi:MULTISPECIES: hypothetical protein [Mycetohabitans]|nr:MULTISPECIES: hypothetical protein [Mycetohabitans]MCG1045964.1 hypothetical protein [Mycetohabitans sp. B6]